MDETCSERQRVGGWAGGAFPTGCSVPKHTHFAQAQGYFCVLRAEKDGFGPHFFLTCFSFLLAKYVGSEFQLQDEYKEHVKSSFKQLLSKMIHFSGV